MQMQQPQRLNATHRRQTQLGSRAAIWWKQVEHLQTRTVWSLHWRGKEVGAGEGPHLEPSSLPFLSNSVETLRCIRQEDKENKIDVDCTFSLQLLGFTQKTWQRCETATQNKSTQKYQEVTESASGEEKTVTPEDERKLVKCSWWIYSEWGRTIKPSLAVFRRSSQQP